METNQQDINNIFNNILMSLLRTLYAELGTEDLATAVEVTLKFDEQQRVSSFDNLLVNGLPKMPSFELSEKLNTLSQELLKLPEIYKLKECKFTIKAGGEYGFNPVYLNN